MRGFPATKLIVILCTVAGLGSGCGGPVDTSEGDQDQLFKQGPSRGTRYFSADYEPGARVSLDGLWLMEDQLGRVVDAIEIYEQEEIVVYARRCRFPSGKALFTSVEVDVDLKGDHFKFQEDTEYTAIDAADTRLQCRLSLVEGAKLYFRMSQKQLFLSTSSSLANAVQFYKVRDNK